MKQESTEGDSDEEEEDMRSGKGDECMKLHKKIFEVSSGQKCVSCCHCDYIYKFDPQDSKANRRAQQILNSHMNDEHAEVKFKCDQCDRSFWTDDQLQNHKEYFNKHQWLKQQTVCASMGVLKHLSTFIAHH